MRKLLALVMSLVLCVGLFAGCQAAPPAAQPGAPTPGAGSAATPGGGEAVTPAATPVTLNYWFEGAGPERTVIHMQMIDEFNAMDNNITINPTYLDIVAGIEQLNVAWVARHMPDVMVAMGSWQASMFVQGMALELDDLFASWDESAYFEEIHVRSIREMDAIGGGRLFAIPYSSNLNGIWYRSDIFAEAGLQSPTTWDNFFYSIEALTRPNADGMMEFGHALRGGSNGPRQFLNVIISYVGYDSYWCENNTAQILRSPRAVEITTRFAEIMQNGWTPDSGLNDGFNEMIANFNAEVAHTMIHNLGSFENQRYTFEPHQYAFRPFPPAVNGHLTALVETAKGVSISSITEHEAAAWELVKHVTSMDNVSLYNEAVGELPVRYDSAAQGWMWEAPHMRYLPEYIEADKFIVAIPTYIPDYNAIQNGWAAPAFQEMLVGLITPEQWLIGWAERVEESYAEFLRHVG